jgi:hypothetical protein
LQWRPAQEERHETETKIPGFEEMMEEIRAELQMAKQDEEQLTMRIVDELQKTEKILGFL